MKKEIILRGPDWVTAAFGHLFDCTVTTRVVHSWYTAWRLISLCPSLPRSRRRQRCEEKARPRGRGRRRRWRRRRLERDWKRALTEFPFLPGKPQHPPSCSSHRLCNPRLHQPSSELSLLGQDCTGWVGQVELPYPFGFCFCFFPTPSHPAPHTHGTESHPTPSTSPPPPSPWFSGSPALSIPQFLSTPLYVFSCEDFGTGM